MTSETKVRRGRQAESRITIVPPNEVLSLDEMRNEENINLTILCNEMNTSEKTLQWCARRRLIKNTKICPNCQELYTFHKGSGKTDGFVWVCPRCKSHKSVRDESFFSRSHLKIQQILTVIYSWCCVMSQKQIARELSLSKSFIIIEWCNLIREQCNVWFQNSYEGIGGINEETGEAIVVEIGKTEYFHRKYYGERFKEGDWTFGGIERGSGRCFLAEVKDCSAQSLQACITQNILPGTYIVSDEWASYAKIDQIHQGIYQHSVNVYNFVDPNDSFIHTQNIKNMWMRAKKNFKSRCGTSEKLLESYLHEFMFRNYYKIDVFKSFLIILATKIY